MRDANYYNVRVFFSFRLHALTDIESKNYAQTLPIYLHIQGK